MGPTRSDDGSRADFRNVVCFLTNGRREMSKNIHQFREIVVIYYSVRIELAQGYLLSNFGLPMLSVRFLFPEENTGRILQSIFIDTDKIRKQTRNVKKVVLSQLFSFL